MVWQGADGVKQVSQSFSDGRIVVSEVPAPALRPHGVLVRTAYSLISAGTERAKVDLGQKSLLAKARSRPDQVKQVLDKVRKDGLLQTYQTVKTRLEEQAPIGYSSAGVVLAVGELAAGLSVGDRVACAGAEYANHAEVVYVPANLCARLPDGVELADAAFSTVGAIAMQGVRQAEVTLGDCGGRHRPRAARPARCSDAQGGRLQRGRHRPRPSQVRARPHARRRRGVGRRGRRAGEARRGVHGGPWLRRRRDHRGHEERRAGGARRRAGRDRGTVVVVGDVGMKLPRKPYYEKELSLRLARSYGPGRYDPLYEEAGIDYPLGYVRWTEQRNMQEFLRLVSRRARCAWGR